MSIVISAEEANRRQDLRIDLAQLNLRDASADDAPARTRLFGQVRIGGIAFHVECWQLKTVDGVQSTVDSEFAYEFEALDAAVNAQSHYQTIEIDGRDYLLFIYPHGR